jgi:hypothetical protein
VHVPLDEARQEDQPRDVDALEAFVSGSDPGHVPPGDGDVCLEGFAREHGVDPTAGKDQIRGLVSPSDGDPADELTPHRRRVADAVGVR